MVQFDVIIPYRSEHLGAYWSEQVSTGAEIWTYDILKLWIQSYFSIVLKSLITLKWLRIFGWSISYTAVKHLAHLHVKF